jgi:spore germination protein KC
MKKTIAFIWVMIFSTMILAGCWSKKELNELAIVAALGIDKTEDGYLVSAQVINPSEIAGKSRSGRPETVTFRKSGKTITDALKKISMDSPRKGYMAHLREVVFGEKMAREGIKDALDILARQPEMRSDFFLTVAKGSTAYDILNVTTALERVPANKLFTALEQSEKAWAPTKTVTLDELINSAVSKGKEPVLMGVYVYGDPESGSHFTNIQDISPSSGLRIDSIGVFKKDKLLGWLNEEESIGFNYITDNVTSTEETVNCAGGELAISTIRSKTKVYGKIQGGAPRIEIHVHSEGNVGEAACDIDLTKPESIKELEKKYKKEIKKRMEASIKTVQKEYKSDIFGFGDVIHRAEPKAWKGLEPNWDQEFSNLNVTFHVTAKIRRLGSITKSIQAEIEE